MRRTIVIAVLASCSSRTADPASEPAAIEHRDAGGGFGRVPNLHVEQARVTGLALRAVEQHGGLLVTIEADVHRPPPVGSGLVMHTLVECKIEDRPKEGGISWESLIEPTGQDPQHVSLENGLARRRLSGCGVALRIQKACSEELARANRCDKSDREPLGGGCLFAAGERWELGDCKKLVIAPGVPAFDPSDS